MTKQPLAILAALAMTAALLAGCGDDDGGATAEGTGADGAVSTSSLTKAAYLEEAEEVCEKGTREMLEEVREYQQSQGNGNTELDAEAVQAVVVPALRSQVEQLHELGAPKGDEEQVEAFLAAMTKAIDEIEQKRLSGNQSLGSAFSQVGPQGRKYGFQACAYG